MGDTDSTGHMDNTLSTATSDDTDTKHSNDTELETQETLVDSVPQHSDTTDTYPTMSNYTGATSTTDTSASSSPLYQSQPADIAQYNTLNPMCKLFIGQVPQHITEQNLIQLFEPYGNILELVILRNKRSVQHKGCAFVTYDNSISAATAIDALHEKVTLHHRPLVVRYAGNEFIPTETKLFVGMLPKYFDESQLSQLFAPYGTVKEVHIMRDIDGVSKGCAFVKMGTIQDALNAVQQLHDTTNNDTQHTPRNLVVKLADTTNINKQQTKTPQVMRYSRQSSTSSSVYSSPYNTTQHSIQYNNPAYNTYVQYSHTHISPSLGSLTPGDINTLSPYNHTRQRSAESNTLQPLTLTPAILTNNQYTHVPVTWSSHSSPTHQSIQHAQQQQYLQPTHYSYDHINTRPIKGADGCNLFIYSIPDTIDDNELASYFTPYGHIISSKVYRDRYTGQSRGFGFISYDNPQSAADAVQHMNGTTIGTKRIKVMLKTEKSQNNPHPQHQQQYVTYHHQFDQNDMTQSFNHLSINNTDTTVPITQH